MDAVHWWSDCNRADGRIHRVDDLDPAYRRPGETIVVYAPREQAEWFTRTWDGAAMTEPVAPIVAAPSPTSGG